MYNADFRILFRSNWWKKLQVFFFHGRILYTDRMFYYMLQIFLVYVLLVFKISTSFTRMSFFCSGWVKRNQLFFVDCSLVAFLVRNAGQA